MPESADLRPARWRTITVCAALFFGTWVVFTRALPYDFTNFDDPSYLLNNAQVQGGLSWSGVGWAFTGKTDYWHPLTWLSHMLDWELYGRNAAGHRTTSVLWHATNGVLVFLLVRRWTGAFWTSAICAALFAWHPLRVESVVWMPERKDVMSGCFFLLTLWAYVRYAEKRKTNSAGRCGAYALTLGLFLGALMCKPVMVALPCVLVLLDLWPLQRWQSGHLKTSWRSLVLEKLPFFALSGLIAIVTLVMQHEAGALTSLSVPLEGRIGNALVSIPRYLGAFFWPFDLAVIYPHPITWPVTTVVAAGALILALTALALWQLRARPWILVGWGWFVAMLAPSIGLVQAGLQSLADRYTYVPVIGLQVACLLTARQALGRPVARWMPATVAALVLAGCVWRTWEQQRVWRDPPTLFQHALNVTTDNYVAHAFYSLTVLSQERVDEAETHSLRAIALQPDFMLGHDTLAMVRTHQKRYAEAMACMERVLEINPQFAIAHSDIGDLLLLLGKREEAVQRWQTALQLNPELAPPHLGLAKDAAQRGDSSSAIHHYAQALRIAPLNAEAHNNLATLLGEAGRFDEAATHMQTATRLAPETVELRANHAALLRDAGRAPEAIAQYRAAIALRPEDARLHVGLAVSLEQVGRAEEATTAYQQALAAQPNLAPAHAGLARLSLRQGNPADAAAHFRRAVAAAPNDPALHQDLGDVLTRTGQIAEAASAYAEAVRLAPHDAELHARLGYSMMLLRRPADAIRSWEEALRLNPEFPGLRERLVQAMQQAGSAP